MRTYNQDSNTHHPHINVDGSMNHDEYLEHLLYDNSAASTGSQNIRKPEQLSFSSNNDYEDNDGGLNTDAVRPPGYSAKSRLSLIPEVHGHSPSSEQDNCESRGTNLCEDKPSKDIKERIEEIKEKIEEITREKESVLSGQRRRPSMGVQALQRT